MKMKIKLPIKNQKPYSHQKKAFSMGITLDQTALIMEQGTGKTLPAIGVIGHRHKIEEVNKVLIICPATVSSVWEDEFEKVANFNYELIDLVGLKSRKRQELLRQTNNSLQIVVINYESAWREINLLFKWKPDMIVLDESQKAKNGRKKQSKATHKLGDITKFKMILTGTPVTQGPLDMWSQYRFLNPNIFGKRFVPFRERYAIMGGFQGHQVIGYRRLKELTNKIYSIAYRVTRDEALDLPPTIDQDLKITLSKEAQSLYKQMERDFLIGFENGEFATASIILTQLLRLQQITGGFITTEKGNIVNIDSAKIEVVKELLEDLPKHKKVVIFARFTPEIEALMELTHSLYIHAMKLTGKVAIRDRGSIIRLFQRNPKVKVLIAQIQTGGLGITLTAADTAIFYSTTFSFADYEQSKARLHRIGQHHPVTYIHLITGGTIDEQIIEVLRDKEKMAEKVLVQKMLRREMIGLEPNKKKGEWVWDEQVGDVIRWGEDKEVETLGNVKTLEEAKELVKKYNKGGIKPMTKAIKKSKKIAKVEKPIVEEETLETEELEELAEEEGTPAKEPKKETKKEARTRRVAERKIAAKTEAKKGKKVGSTKGEKEEKPTGPKTKKEKPAKEPKSQATEIITVADLAKELKKPEKVIRRALRELFTDHEPRAPWEFKPGGKDHQKIQKAFNKKQ